MPTICMDGLCHNLYPPTNLIGSLKEIKSIDFTKVKDDADEGYISEVDLEYPEEIHDMQITP